MDPVIHTATPLGNKPTTGTMSGAPGVVDNNLGPTNKLSVSDTASYIVL
jgi:hypothetical protein